MHDYRWGGGTHFTYQYAHYTVSGFRAIGTVGGAYCAGKGGKPTAPARGETSMFWRKKVFVSYSHVHSGQVETFVDILALTNVVFFDSKSLRHGEDWKRSIHRSIRRSHIVLLFWCAHSSKSQYVAEELTTALELGKNIIPVLLDQQALPPSISHIHAITSTRSLCQVPLDVDTHRRTRSVGWLRPSERIKRPIDPEWRKRCPDPTFRAGSGGGLMPAHERSI